MQGFVDWVKDSGFLCSSEVVDSGHYELFPIAERILRHCLTPKEDGTLPYRRIILAEPKKSGKTLLAAAIGTWYIREVGPSGSEVYVCANDIEQAEARVFAAMRWHFDHENEDLPPVDRSRTQKFRIDLPNGSFVKVLAKHYRSAAGAQPGCTLFDELWAYTSEDAMRMWAEMTIPPTVKNPIQVIVTYAGYENETPNLLLDLYNKVVKNGTVVEELKDITDSKGPVCYESGGTFCYWDHEPRMPWQTPEYYEQEMQGLRPSDFLRMHRVEWVTTEEQFMPIEWYDKCTTLTAPLMLQPQNPARTLPMVIGVDIGVKHDCTAGLGMYYDMMRPQVGLGFHRIWTPPPGMIGLDLEETIEAWIIQMAKAFKVAAIVYDPSQFHRSMVTLHKRGLPLVEFTQSSTNMIAATQNMYDLFRQGIMAVYPDDQLRQHVHFAKAKVDERGFRLVKDKESTYPIDAAVAMAMASYYVVKVGGIDTSNRIRIESPFSDATGWDANYIDQSMLPEPLRDKR